MFKDLVINVNDKGDISIQLSIELELEKLINENENYIFLLDLKKSKTDIKDIKGNLLLYGLEDKIIKKIVIDEYVQDLISLKISTFPILLKISKDNNHSLYNIYKV
jgi:tRNA(Leu) C34 or U34 (ribose-2'-O)-methylase TrmL